MPVYLRIFYFRKLNEAKELEKKEYEKAKRGQKGPSSINPPSFAKSPPKSPKR